MANTDVVLQGVKDYTLELLGTKARDEAVDAADRAEAQADRAEAAADNAETGIRDDTVAKNHLTPGLRDELDGKAERGHGHDWSDINADIRAGASIVPMSATGDVQAWTEGVMEEVIDPTAPGGRYYQNNGGTQYLNPVYFQVDDTIPYYYSFWIRADKAGSMFYMELDNGTTQVPVESTTHGWVNYFVENLAVPTEWTKYEGVLRFKPGMHKSSVSRGYFNHPRGSVTDATIMLTDITLVPLAPHTHTAAQVGARPDTWTPTAQDVGARPDSWTPTAAQVGAATPAYVDSRIQEVTADQWPSNPQPGVIYWQAEG